MASHADIESKSSACIRECAHCRTTCETTLMHCLELGGQHAAAEHVTLLLDCADICRTCEHFLMHGSRHFAAVSRLCAEVCEDCAVDCLGLADELMRRCSDVCHHCAETCRAQACAGGLASQT